jgi:hypothetical protein
MKFRMSSWAWACVWVSAVGAGCDSEPAPREVTLAQIEQEVIAVVCDRMFACDCPNGRFYQSEGQCEDVTGTLADQLRGTADMQGLTWDPTCLGGVLDPIEDAGCGSSFDLGDIDECAPPCHYLHGSAGSGQACEIYDPFVSDCDQGLECIAGFCAEPCSDDPSDMRGDVGESCDNGCKDGLFCGFDSVCESLPKLGQNCDFGQCEAGLFCEAADPDDPMTPLVCKAPVGQGEACRGHQQCESGFCPAGFCAELPGEGDSCRGTFVCGPGLDCIEDVCVPGAPAVCQINVPLPGL